MVILAGMCRVCSLISSVYVIIFVTFVIAVFSLFISHYIPPYSVFIQQYLLYIALINTYTTIYTEINTICYQWVPSVKGLARYYS